ncbi:MAG: MetQ/NlpA family ABC transporter substrate-binding protein [Chloroflexi bacterium]|nr:MetQ/NlpA family ABC transporter substrate-binding protein [Chloroflexota bacterium]MCL5076456.1 MetQ/NlpA family ABC transporter substrate-binding protein [Chloroflexota bacterium]
MDLILKEERLKEGKSTVSVIIALGLLLASGGILLGCAPSGGEDINLKIGMLPIVDSLPFYVAEKEGYYRAHNVAVELVPFASALERDAALQAGQIDGQLNDLISSALFNRERDQARIVLVTFRGSRQQAMISILAAGDSPIKSAADLRQAEIAISKNSVIDYVTDQLLLSAGLKPGEVKRVEVSKIPLRLEMLINKQVAAAALPEPFTTLARQQGARVILDDGESQIGQSVLTFRQEVLKKRPDVVKRLIQAQQEAVRQVNADPEKYRELLVEKAKVPPAVKTIYQIPRFPLASVPTRSEIARATDWMVEKGLLSRSLAYEDMVNDKLLSK